MYAFVNFRNSDKAKRAVATLNNREVSLTFSLLLYKSKRTGRMYAFVNFRNSDEAKRAVATLNDREVSPITGQRKLVIKFRPSKKALGKSADGPGAEAAVAAAHRQSDEGSDMSASLSGEWCVFLRFLYVLCD